MIRPPGTSIPMVSITVARLRQAGIGEARRNVCSVWSVPLRDLAPALGALGLAGLAAAAPLGAQACREPHYRWTQKTDTALADVAPQPTSVAVILATWAPPHLGPRDRCAPRSDHELETYSVTAWVRGSTGSKTTAIGTSSSPSEPIALPIPASWSRSRRRDTARATRGPGRSSTRLSATGRSAGAVSWRGRCGRASAGLPFSTDNTAAAGR